MSRLGQAFGAVGRVLARGPAKGGDYYSHPRTDVRALVPATARVVVDVGCGAGVVGAAIKAERPGTEVRGVEPQREPAARAARVLDDVAVMAGDGEMPASWPAPDCVIFADVLEHMQDPWGALRRWRSNLRRGGHVIVSLPNVGHVFVLQGLWRGRWDYTAEGLLDRTHLRFFTRATAVELLETAGFEIEVIRRGIQFPAGRLGHAALGPVVYGGVALEAMGHTVPGWALRVLDACTYEFLLRGKATGHG